MCAVVSLHMKRHRIWAICCRAIVAFQRKAVQMLVVTTVSLIIQFVLLTGFLFFRWLTLSSSEQLYTCKIFIKSAFSNFWQQTIHVSAKWQKTNNVHNVFGLIRHENVSQQRALLIKMHSYHNINKRDGICWRKW